MRILNTREKKEINQQIDDQWGCEIDKEMVWLLSNKNKLYVAEKDIAMVDMDKLRVDNLGLYVATVDDKGVRLSIEGSQLIGPAAKKNVLEIDSWDDVRLWFKGKDLDIDPKETKGFVILKHKDDFLGCGRVTERGILNFVTKARRINADA